MLLDEFAAFFAGRSLDLLQLQKQLEFLSSLGLAHFVHLVEFLALADEFGLEQNLGIDVFQGHQRFFGGLHDERLELLNVGVDSAEFFLKLLNQLSVHFDSDAQLLLIVHGLVGFERLDVERVCKFFQLLILQLPFELLVEIVPPGHERSQLSCFLLLFHADLGVCLRMSRSVFFYFVFDLPEIISHLVHLRPASGNCHIILLLVKFSLLFELAEFGQLLVLALRHLDIVGLHLYDFLLFYFEVLLECLLNINVLAPPNLVNIKRQTASFIAFSHRLPH